MTDRKIYNERFEKENTINLRIVDTCSICTEIETKVLNDGTRHISCKKYSGLISGWEMSDNTICDNFKEDTDDR